MNETRWFRLAGSALLTVAALAYLDPSTRAQSLPRPSSSTPQKPVPAGGVSLLPSNDIARNLPLAGNKQYGRVETVSVTAQPFTTAVRLTTDKLAPNTWDIEAGTATTHDVKKGDVVLIRFWIRAIQGQAETGEARTIVDFQTGAPGYEKSVSQGIGFGKEWKRHDIPFVVGYDSAAGAAQLFFRMGFEPQAFEVADLQVLNFQNRIPLAALPRSRSDYAGQENNAPWRQAALARIEKIRKGDLTIIVRGSNGKPVSGAKVTVAMTRQAFGFGSAVAADEITGSGPDNDRYRAVIKELYNEATIENHLKWPFWETWGRTDGLKALDWLDTNHVRVRAHNIIWPGWSNLPPDLPALKNDKAALTKRIDDHIVSVTDTFRGRVYDWDVVNEPYTNHDLLDIFGPDVMADWFRLTRAHDPNAHLYLNDYPTLDGAAIHDAHLNSFYDNIARLQRLGAPLDGIGFQCHFGSEVVPPERILSGLDRFARFGLPIIITEFDINTQDEDLQTRYMRDFLTAAFSHPSVDAIIMWGFWEKRHWLPNAALYGADWSITPHGQVWLDLVKRDWWTSTRAVTDRTGRAQVRGFYGTYKITVTTADGKTRTVPTALAKNRKNTLVVTVR